MFGGLSGGGFDDLLGNHMQRMNNMMSSFFGGPFGNDPFMTGVNPGVQGRPMSLMPFGDPTQQMLSPFGFPNMGQMMRGMGQISTDPNCQSFSSSSVMTMTTGPDGKPQVYQASESTKSGPGGIRETKKSLCDSRTGVKKLAIGRHIGERGHIKEKEQNVFTGQVEENDEYINLEEEEEPEFKQEWQTKAQQFRPRSVHQAIGYHQPSHRRNETEYLALPPSSSGESDGHHLEEEKHHKKRNHRSAPYSKRKEKRQSKNQE